MGNTPGNRPPDPRMTRAHGHLVWPALPRELLQWSVIKAPDRSDPSDSPAKVAASLIRPRKCPDLVRGSTYHWVKAGRLKSLRVWRLCLIGLREPGPFAAVLQFLHLDKCLLEHQNAKKLYGTKNNCMLVQLGANSGPEYQRPKKPALHF